MWQYFYVIEHRLLVGIGSWNFAPVTLFTGLTNWEGVLVSSLNLVFFNHTSAIYCALSCLLNLNILPLSQTLPGSGASGLCFLLRYMYCVMLFNSAKTVYYKVHLFQSIRLPWKQHFCEALYSSSERVFFDCKLPGLFLFRFSHSYSSIYIC